MGADAGGPLLRALKFARRRSIRFAAASVAAAILALLLIRLAGPAADLEAQLADRVRIALATPQQAPHSQVSLVLIDEATMAKLPYRSPVDRSFIAELITLLDAAGARAIGLDILFDQPTEPAKDQALAAAIAAFDGTTVVAWADERAGMTQAQLVWLQQFIEASGAAPGFANLSYDGDGVVRSHFTSLPGANTPSFAAALAGAAAPQNKDGKWRIDWLQMQDAASPPFQKTPAHILPLMRANPQILETWYKDRIVLIGADLPQQDRHATALSSVLNGGQTAGVEVHGHLIAQILDGRTAPALSEWQRAAYVLVAAVLATAIATLRLHFLLRIFLLGAAVAAHLGLVLLAFQEMSLVPPIIAPLIAMVLAASGAMGIDAVLAHRDRRFVREAFGRYLAPALVDRLVKDPSALKLGGVRQRMTFLFTDIAGFTSMSERMDAEALADLLNNYLDGVSAIVIQHDGVIDKYIGDAVVALFGAPAEDPAHAAKALTCAAAIDAFSESFRRRHADARLGETRIGVHTGEAIVGNFGGHARFDYTAIGDAMNTAARLEGANKAFGTRVCFSQDCFDAAEPYLDQAIDMRPVGGVILKGKTEPITVIALAAGQAADWLADYAIAFQKLTDDPAEALRRFGLLGGDTLVELHAQRLQRGETGPVFELTEK